MKTPSFLARTPIDSPNRSGFDLPFSNMFTGRCGTLYPVMMKECLPNETHSLSLMFDAELPPMVSNFYGRVDIVFEAFFCPMSLLWGGWERFAMHPTSNPVYPEGAGAAVKPRAIPHIEIDSSDTTTFEAGTLADFLGVKSLDTSTGGQVYSFNVLPFACYHRIYDDWYRNSIVQAPVFYPQPATASLSPSIAASLPYNTLVYTEQYGIDNNVYDFSSSVLGDGLTLLDLRQRNWNLDYFTAATPQPQAGGASKIVFNVSVDTSNGQGAGEISVAAIRQANAIQQWMERNNIAGYDYADQVYAQYGIYPDARQLRKPIYLGRYIEPVYNRSVFSTAVDTSSTFPNPQFVNSNPFNFQGTNTTRYGASQANGRNQLFSKFTSSDHGFLVVMCSLRPHAVYSSGVNRMLHRRHIGDIAFPLLSSVGDQAIYTKELSGDSFATGDVVFGYIDRYAEYKCALDEAHGLLRDGEDLAPFLLQRSFDADTGAPSISSAFLEIPQDYLDQVKQVRNYVVPVDYWAEVFFDYKKISPLPVYSVPTLGDLRNAHTEYMRRGGSRL